MQGLLIVLSLAAIALARPDIGLQIRQSQFGTPSGSYLPGSSSGFHNHGSGGHEHHGHDNHGHDNHGYGSHQHGTVNNGYNGGSSFHGSDLGGLSSQSGSTFANNNAGYNNNNGYNNNDGFGSSSTGSVSEFNSGSSRYHGGFNGGSNGFNGGSNSGSNGFHGSSSGFIGQSGGAPVVHKQSYFYDAPEDHEATQLRIHTQGGSAQHNYKLIFVKAPSYKAPQVPQIPTQEQHEERTRIYVLVKKQDAVQDIVIPTIAPSKQNKPEVFFIKYKTQKEAEEQIHGIEQGASSGISAHSVGSDSELVSTIQDTKENSHNGGYDNGNNGGFDNQSFQSGQVNTIGGGSHSEHSTGGASHNTGSGSHPTGHGGDSHEHATHQQGTFVSGNSGSNNNFGPAGESGPY